MFKCQTYPPRMAQIDFLVPNKVPEVYTLEQKQEALSNAEQELDALLRSSEDFFESREDMDATLREIRQHPDQVYTKPFMKKIAAAILRVNACQQEVEWASESVVDTSLTPAQVKAQVKQMLEAQRVALEQQFEQRMKSERSEWTAQLQQLRDEFEEERDEEFTDQLQKLRDKEVEERKKIKLVTQLLELRQELDEERQHRKAFQAKVKNFSEDVYIHLCKDGFTRGWFPNSADNWSYEHLGFARSDKCVIIKRVFPTHNGDVSQTQMEDAIRDFKFTVFDGTEK